MYNVLRHYEDIGRGNLFKFRDYHITKNSVIRNDDSFIDLVLFKISLSFGFKNKNSCCNRNIH
jgi:hypothetical protein